MSNIFTRDGGVSGRGSVVKLAAAGGRPFPNRLERDFPWKQSRGCALLVGVIALLFFGTPLVMFLRTSSIEAHHLVFAVLLTGTLFGAVMVFWGIYQTLAARVPQTVIELSSNEVRAGTAMKVRVLQPGPARLASFLVELRRRDEQQVNIFDEETRQTIIRNEFRVVFERVFIHENDLKIGRDEAYEAIVDLPLPPNAPPSNDTLVYWTVHVHGDVAGGADFDHEFPVRVI